MADDLSRVRAGAVVELAERDRHHLGDVLRRGDGAAVTAGDGAGTTVATRLAAGRLVAVADAALEPPRRPALRVLQALPKGRKMDAVVRTLTELGVERLTPVASERAVMRLEGARAARAVERWQAVARSAAEQARNPWRPHIDLPVAVAAVAADGPVLVADTAAPSGSLATALARIPRDTAAVTLAVGPEGGWSPAEVARLGQPVRLGATVLRTEHAAAALVAVVAHALGRLD